MFVALHVQHDAQHVYRKDGAKLLVRTMLDLVVISLIALRVAIHSPMIMDMGTDMDMLSSTLSNINRFIHLEVRNLSSVQSLRRQSCHGTIIYRHSSQDLPTMSLTFLQT